MSQKSHKIKYAKYEVDIMLKTVPLMDLLKANLVTMQIALQALLPGYDTKVVELLHPIKIADEGCIPSDQSSCMRTNPVIQRRVSITIPFSCNINTAFEPTFLTECMVQQLDGK